MKNMHIRYAALLLFVLLSASASPFAQTVLEQKINAISAIKEIRPLETSEFSEKYVTYFTQPLDHRHPEKGSFRQRVIVSHVGFDRPTVIVTEGYGAAYALRSQYREELSKLLNANMIFVEYRYFLESTPEPKDWQYLTAENSADDLHAITTAFKNIYPGKWIATGISKGGQTTLLYRTFYPDDVDISVPYVAPLCYGVEDGRHEPFLHKVSTPENRKKIEDFQLEALKRKATLLPRFEKYCTEKNYSFRAPIEEIYDYSVLEYSFALWQWGTPISSIPATTASDDEIFSHLLAISEPGYFTADSPNASFFVQAARELGYYGYDVQPFKQYLSIQSSEGYLHRLMLPEELKDMPFDKTLSKKITKFLKKQDPKMIFIYGQNDPWTAAGVTWLKNKKNIHVFIQPNGSHLARISTLPEAEKAEVMELINEWLK
ncbi:S28 family serine protease [Bacteroides intestinalis]|uniref:PS-10 peptidase S37 n=1 Tax=Bacteroides intestinalis TaxID=329854 RepID=A0A139LB05_9BACE|nr:S28 family serine protease [Bacteroides intestinalis]KXT48632.1 PS-10 peptidase S37 [Bacteroides intestinalis]